MRQFRDDFFHIVYESHIEHAIRFIQDEELNMFQIDISLIHEIEKSSWGRDKNIKTVPQSFDLSTLSDASEDDFVIELYIFPVVCKTLTDLYREFTSRSQNKRSNKPFTRW